MFESVVCVQSVSSSSFSRLLFCSLSLSLSSCLTADLTAETEAEEAEAAAHLLSANTIYFSQSSANGRCPRWGGGRRGRKRGGRRGVCLASTSQFFFKSFCFCVCVCVCVFAQQFGRTLPVLVALSWQLAVTWQIRGREKFREMLASVLLLLPLLLLPMM